MHAKSQAIALVAGHPTWNKQRSIRQLHENTTGIGRAIIAHNGKLPTVQWMQRIPHYDAGQVARIM